MTDVSGLWEVVGIFLDFLPIVIMILLVALLIGFIIILFTASGASSKLAKKLNMVVPLIFGLMILTMSAPGSGALMAESVSFDTPIVFSGTIINLHAEGLTPATEYTIWSDHSATLKNITFTASTSEFFVPYPCPADSDDQFTISIAASTAGVAAAAVGTAFVQLSDPGAYLPTDFFFDMLTPIILIAVIVGVVVAVIAGVVVRGRKREGLGGL